MESQSETTQTVSTLKLPVLKTGDYDLEQYLTHTDYALWEVIVNVINCCSISYAEENAMAPRNQGNKKRCTKKDVPVETPCQMPFGFGSRWDMSVYDWSIQAKEGLIHFALMPSYQMGLESLEARIVVHEKNEAVYEEDIAFLKYDVQVKDISIKDLKNQLEEALKEKDDLKLKLENFEESSKNLTKLINSQISAKDKAGLGYDSQMNESEVVNSVFNSKESDVDDSPVNDRFKIGEGFHAVPPPYTRNYMPSRPDLSFAGLDDYVYKAKVSETITTASKTSKDSVEKPKTVRPSAPIIEDWDTDNDGVFRPKPDQTKPKFTKINFVKSDKNVKSVNKKNTHRQEEYLRKSQNPRDNRRNWNEMMTQKLGNGFKFIKNACFVCRSFNHLIKDCDFHDKKMVEKPVLNNKGRVNGQSTFANYQNVDGGFVAFAGSPKGGKITRKGKIRTGKLDFEDVYFVKELKFNLFPVSLMCDKKNSVLFTETECLVLSPDFKLLDESQVLLKVPRKNNMYIFELKNIVPSGVSTACYVQNRVLVTKPHNKTPYELLHGRPPSISFMRPFGCPVTILNTLDPLGKFDGKADEGFFVGYSINSKAFRVFNTRTRKKEGYANSTNRDSTVSLSVSTARQNFTNANDLPTDPLIPDLEDTGIFSGAYDYEDVGA
ncbi:ribonuclease H-like domain-containing protein [Tanacetum coccineum]